MIHLAIILCLATCLPAASITKSFRPWSDDELARYPALKPIVAPRPVVERIKAALAIAAQKATGGGK